MSTPRYDFVDWASEELAEFADAQTRPERLDALLDLLGLIYVQIGTYTNSEICAAFKEYEDAQRSRGRTRLYTRPAFTHALLRLQSTHVDTRCSVAFHIYEAKERSVAAKGCEP